MTASNNGSFTPATAFAEAFKARMDYGRRCSAERGGIVHAGFGYERTESGVVVDRAQLAVALSIYDDVASGVSPAAVAARLADGASTSAPRTARAVRRFVVDPLHIGVVVWGRTRTVTDPETGVRRTTDLAPGDFVVAHRPELAIVDDGLFARAAKALAARKRDGRARGGALDAAPDAAVMSASLPAGVRLLGGAAGNDPALAHLLCEGPMPGSGLTAVGYARIAYSSAGEASLARQKAAIEACAEGRGWRLAAVYEDDGASGMTRAGRPALDKLLEAARGGAFDVVVVDGLDRLGRHFADVAAIHGRLRADGVVLHDLREAPTGLRRAASAAVAGQAGGASKMRLQSPSGQV